MANWLIAFLVGIGGGTWVWNLTMKRTMRKDTSLIVGFVVGLAIFIVILTVTKLFMS